MDIGAHDVDSVKRRLGVQLTFKECTNGIEDEVVRIRKKKSEKRKKK